MDHPEQKRFIHALVADLEVATAELDTCAAALQRSLQHIDDQRKRCGKLVDNYKSLVAPIALVPCDVLSIIFDFYIHNSDWPPHMLINKAPLTLSHVCAGWRTLLLDSPRHWSEQGVKYHWVNSERGNTLPLFTFFLERVRSHPFRVNLNLVDVGSTSKVIGKSANRWRTLELQEYDDDLDATMAAFGFPRPADALETLDYRLTMVVGGDTSRFFRPFEQCKNLRDLRLVVELDDDTEDEGAIIRLVDIAETRFCWERLTTLHLKVKYPAGDVLRILQACARLEELRFESYYDDMQDWASTRGGSPISMMCLLRLELPCLNMLLKFIHCPILEDLMLGSLDSEPIAAFVDASRPPLRNLHIKPGKLPSDIDVSSLYTRFPKVDTLSFDSFELSTLCAFLPPRTHSSTPAMLPRSRHLVLNIFKTIANICADEYSVPILAFIDAHWRIEERYLESLTLVATGGPRGVAYPPRDEIRSTPLMEALGVYRGEGLKVTVLANPSWGAYTMVLFYGI